MKNFDTQVRFCWPGTAGESTLHVVLEQLRRKRVPEQSFRSVLALLGLIKKYDRERLLETLSIAHYDMLELMENGTVLNPR